MILLVGEIGGIMGLVIDVIDIIVFVVFFGLGDDVIVIINDYVVFYVNVLSY